MHIFAATKYIELFRLCNSLEIPVRIFIFFAITTQLLVGCTYRERGVLFVAAKGSGNYEIYRIASEHPLQFTSETIGEFNKSIELDSGSYLLFADCSSEAIVVKSGLETKLIADRIEFTPPTDVPLVDEAFTIQCTRHEKTQTRQRLTNTFQLNLLRGDHDLLVGLTPLHVKRSTTPSPMTLNFTLSSFKIQPSSEFINQTRYFVSAAESKVAVTESQRLGDAIFLLPGSYIVELNGSSLAVDLEAGAHQVIEPASIRVSTPPQANLALASSIQGNPLFVEINGGHWLSLNETYPVLPGAARLRLVGSEKDVEVMLKSGEILDQKARAIQVNLNCPPWDWSCLGSRRIYLYTKTGNYPFAQGVSDVPLLYFENDAWLTIEGSREIRVHLATHKDYLEFDTATITIVPKPHHRPGSFTDLARVETIGNEEQGNTLDLSLTSPTTLHLLPGSYLFAEYVTFTGTDGDRRKSAQRINLKAKEKFELEFESYLNEKKYRSLVQQPLESQTLQRNIRRRMLTQKYRMARPVSAL